MCKLFVGQWHKEMHAWMQRTSNPLGTVSVVQEIYGSAISIEEGGRGVLVRGMHGAIWIAPKHNKPNIISAPPSVWRLLGRTGAEWKHTVPGRAGQPAIDYTGCRPNKRQCWHEPNSADLGSGAWEWWNPDGRTGACSLIFVYSQWRYGKDPPGCSAWIQPERLLLW